MKTIVALVDFSEITSRILKMAETLASALRSHIVLLHVVPPEPVVATLGGEAPVIPEPRSAQEIEVDNMRLQELLNSLTRAGVSASALQFEGPVVGTVLEETKKVNADLVIMGSHHHNAFYNLFIGSLAADLMKRLPVPVLVVPADVPEKEMATTDRTMSAEEMRRDQPVMQPVLSA